MQSKKKHMHWQHKEQNFKGTRQKNNSERNAVMVRGRQLEELSLCSPTAPLLSPLFCSQQQEKFSEQE
jgi:hypothetical protein